MVAEMTPAAWLMLIGLLVQTMVLVSTGTWWLGRCLSGLRDDIRIDRRELDHTIANVENDMRDKLTTSFNEVRQLVDSIARLLTNSLSDLREQLHKHELHVRDEYVRRDDFYAVANDIKQVLNERLKVLEEEMRGLRNQNS